MNPNELMELLIHNRNTPAFDPAYYLNMNCKDSFEIMTSTSTITAEINISNYAQAIMDINWKGE
jgi:hypothetical protein